METLAIEKKPSTKATWLLVGGFSKNFVFLRSVSLYKSNFEIDSKD